MQTPAEAASDARLMRITEGYGSGAGADGAINAGAAGDYRGTLGSGLTASLGSVIEPVPDAVQIETIVLNLDAALRVHTRPHFFNWTQGLLQSLIRSDVLVCALCNGQPFSFRAESFSTAASNASVFSDAFLQDAAVTPTLIKAWEENRYRPVVCNAGEGGPFAGTALARELARHGATRIVAHGTHDAAAQVTSLYAFACAPGAVLPRQDYFIELLTPSLHAAWLRTQINRPEGAAGAKQVAATNPLTAREKDILGWIYLGKSNYEVGMILKISPLTVKNHVQKILRKLDVVNRTQAVGKALESRILCP